MSPSLVFMYSDDAHLRFDIDGIGLFSWQRPLQTQQTQMNTPNKLNEVSSLVMLMYMLCCYNAHMLCFSDYQDDQ